MQMLVPSANCGNIIPHIGSHHVETKVPIHSVIVASLSEPHTSETALRMSVHVYTYIRASACSHIP